MQNTHTGYMPNFDTSSSCSCTSFRLLPAFFAINKTRCRLVRPQIAMCSDMVSRNLVLEPWSIIHNYSKCNLP